MLITLDLKYQQKLNERNAIVYALNSNYKPNNENLYLSVSNFNNSLIITKKFNKSLWTNWFVNDKIAELDYIDYEANGK